MWDRQRCGIIDRRNHGTVEHGVPAPLNDTGAHDLPPGYEPNPYGAVQPLGLRNGDPGRTHSRLYERLVTTHDPSGRGGGPGGGPLPGTRRRLRDLALQFRARTHGGRPFLRLQALVGSRPRGLFGAGAGLGLRPGLSLGERLGPGHGLGPGLSLGPGLGLSLGGCLGTGHSLRLCARLP